MTRRLKVYGYVGFVARERVPGRQARIIVAATSLTEARRFLEANTYVDWPGRDYIDETSNDTELALATERGDIYAQPSSPIDGRDWVKLT